MSQITTVDINRFEGGLFFSLTVRKWGARAKVKSPAKLVEYLSQLAAATPDGESTPAIDLPANARVTASNATKTTYGLLKSEAYDKLCTFLNETKQKLVGPFGKANPSRIKEGLFVVSKTLIQEFEDQLNAANDKLSLELIPAFVADYQDAKRRAQETPVSKGGLGPLYSPQDYPPEDELENLFGLEWQWLALGVPEDLPEALRAEANAKFQRQMEEAANEVRDALRASLGGFVDHLIERLQVQPGEKPKIFRDTAIGNIAQFCEVFDARNIMGDAELSQLVNRAKQVIADVTPDKLRQFSEVRQNTLAGFQEIKAQLDTLITERKSRRFDLAEA